MARKAESAYEKRIRSYLERHPGATRQQARGHSEPHEHRRRVRRAEARGKSPAAARGKSGQAAFLAYIRDGDYVTLALPISRIEMDDRGRYREIPKLVVPLDDARPERTFTIRNLSQAGLARMIRDEIARGADLTPVPSRDQRRL